MGLPAITGKECTAKLSVRQFSDLQFPPINNVQDNNKLNRVWSTVCSKFLKTETKIKQCASQLCKNKVGKNEKLSKQTSGTDFDQESAKKILSEDRSLKEMVSDKPSECFIGKSLSNKGTDILWSHFLYETFLQTRMRLRAINLTLSCHELFVH